MSFLWRFTWWRYFVIQAVRYAPPSFGNWLSYRSGLSEGLEDFFRAAGDYRMVQVTRASRGRMRQLYGP